MNHLSFNSIQFHPIQQNDSQIWITSSELANALGYADIRSVTKIYNRYADEFTNQMTQVIDNPQTVNLTVSGFGNGNSEYEDEFNEKMTQAIEITEVVNLGTSNLVSKVRIFSLRGCHLIAMFARTAVAKKFRKWVLDILDKESQPKPLTDIRDRIPLAEAIGILVSKSNFNTIEVYEMLHQRFDVKHVKEIPYDVLPYAVEYVHQLTTMVARSHELQHQETRAVQQLVEAIINQNFKMMNVWNALTVLNPNEFLRYSSFIVRSNERALELSKRYNLRGLNGEPLVSSNFRYVSFSNGDTLETYPNWFNAPA
ncbi:MAG: BRO family protein [Acinetobacter sp.]